MSNPIDVKSFARNSMLEKLQAKIQKKNIKVQAYEELEEDEESDESDDREENEDEIYREFSSQDIPSVWKLSGDDEHGLVLVTEHGEYDLGYTKHWDEDDLRETIQTIYDSLAEEDQKIWDKYAYENKIVTSKLRQTPIFAVVLVGDNMIGGTLATVEAELAKTKAENYEVKIITSDENAAKAFFRVKDQIKASNGPTHFKLSHPVTLDMYTFNAGKWIELGGDFLASPSKESLVKVLKEEMPKHEGNPKFDELKIEYKDSSSEATIVKANMQFELIDYTCTISDLDMTDIVDIYKKGQMNPDATVDIVDGVALLYKGDHIGDDLIETEDQIKSAIQETGQDPWG